MCYLYVLVDPTSGEIRYVGWTAKALSTRLASHLRDRCKCHRTWWIKSLARVGLKPQIRLIQEVPDGLQHEAECYWISYFLQIGCPLTNGTRGGEGMLGHSPSPETRAKLSAAAKRQFEDPTARDAVSRVHRGKQISEEHRAIVSAASKAKWERWRQEGMQASPETRSKISAARKGTLMSEESRSKISSTSKGRPKSEEHRAKIREGLKQAWARKREEGPP